MVPARIKTLDSVRGIAAAIVLCYHVLTMVPAYFDFFWAHDRADLAFSDAPGRWLMFFTPLRLLWVGHDAVILFFVLSGFVLALPWIEGRPPSYPTYLMRRFCRIYLPYLAAAALGAVLLTLIPHHEADPEALLHSGDWNNHVVTAATIRDYVFMLGGYEQRFVDKVTWSLVHEMRISLFFPLLVLPILRWRALGLGLVMAILLLLIALLPPSPPWLASVPETIAYAVFFAMGALLAQNAARLRAALAHAPFAGTILLGAGLLLIWQHYARFFDVMSAVGACLVIAAALTPGRIERVLLLPPLRWLGEVSYSLYLVHVPVLLSIYYLARDSVPFAVIAVMAAPAALVAASLFHRWIEAPAIRLGRALSRAPVPAFGGLGGAD